MNRASEIRVGLTVIIALAILIPVLASIGNSYS